MATLPMTGDKGLVIRTDFANQAGWEATCEAILAPGAEARLFTADVEFVDDPDFAGWTPAQILTLVTDEFTTYQGCLFIADWVTVSTAGWPVLVVDVADEKGRQFRAVADEVHGIEANLAICNMGFAEFAKDAEDAGGVFRGFAGPSRAETIAQMRAAMRTHQVEDRFMEEILSPPEPRSGNEARLDE